MPAQVNYFITLSPSAEAMRERLGTIARYKIPLALKRGIDVAMPDVIERIKADRLSGKGPFPPDEHRLGEVTGLLKSSVSPITATMQVSEDSCSADGGLQVIGVPYANIHEFGFVGEESVKEHSRGTIRIQKHLRRQKQRTTEKQILTGRLPRAQTIRAHTRQMNMPSRAPFRTGVQENLVRISDSISTELAHALENV